MGLWGSADCDRGSLCCMYYCTYIYHSVNMICTCEGSHAWNNRAAGLQSKTVVESSVIPFCLSCFKGNPSAKTLLPDCRPWAHDQSIWLEQIYFMLVWNEMKWNARERQNGGGNLVGEKIRMICRDTFISISYSLYSLNNTEKLFRFLFFSVRNLTRSRVYSSWPASRPTFFFPRKTVLSRLFRPVPRR